MSHHDIPAFDGKHIFDGLLNNSLRAFFEVFILEWFQL